MILLYEIIFGLWAVIDLSIKELLRQIYSKKSRRDERPQLIGTPQKYVHEVKRDELTIPEYDWCCDFAFEVNIYLQT